MTECAGCGQPILDRYVFNVLGKSWHQSCLRCSDCLCHMTDTCFSRDGLIFCRTDFQRRFGQRCSGCDGPLEKEDLVRRARDKVFHVDCFVCAVCTRRLDTGEQLYILEGNRFVCQNDFQNATKSSTPSTNSNRPVSAGSECNSDADEETVETSEEIGLDEGDGSEIKGGDDASSAKRRGPRTTIKAKQDSSALRKGAKTAIKPVQLETLKNAFATTPKPTRHIREQLAQETGLNMRVIQVWFQNRRSKERRMKQLRFGGYRPARRSRGGRDDMQDIFNNEAPPPFFGQPPMNFFCDPYAAPPPPDSRLPPLPPAGLTSNGMGNFMPPPENHHTMVHDGFVERNSPLSGATTVLGDFDPEMNYHSLPSMYPAELKPMAGW